MNELKALLILIVIISIGIIVMICGYIIPYLKNRKRIKENKEKRQIQELIKNNIN